MGGRGGVAAALAIWAGLWAGERWAHAGAALVPVACAAIALVWIACRRGPGRSSADGERDGGDAFRRTASVALWAACLIAAFARGAAHEAALRAAESGLAAADRPAWLRGRVTDHPWIESGEPVAILETEDSEAGPARGWRVRVRLPPGADAEWGDRLEILARLEPLRPCRSPGGVDAREQARTQEIVAQGRAFVVRRVGAPRGPWRATVTRWRRGIESAFARALSPSAREIVTPLVVGDRSGVGAELGARFQAAGLTHLLALSGLHVAWMAGVARGLVACVGGGPVARAAAGALCALFYVGIAGPLPSLMRAAATEAVGAWARGRDRALDPLQSLAFGVAAILVVAPGWVDDLGFQLSCAATLGLVTIGAGLAAPLTRARPRVLAAVARAMTPTLAAQVAALPLMLGRFHALPWTTLAANLAAVPVCDLLLASAWLGALAEAALPGAGGWAFGACEALAQALRGIAGLAATAPAALLPAGHGAALPALAALGAALLAASAAPPRALDRAARRLAPARFHARALGAWLVVLALALVAIPRPLAPPPGRWWLVALDVGQGDALALGLPDGWWLVDAGPASSRFDAGRGTDLPFFRWAGVKTLETLALTHAHADHVGGAAAVASGLAVRRWVRRAGVRLPAGVRGSVVAARGDTLRQQFPRVRALWPPAGARIADENAQSLVLEVGAGAGRALLLADVDSTVEASLETAPGVAALKVAHHGAATSSGALALARLAPSQAVISCGLHNPFGHPDALALERLERGGAIVHRTDREGTVWLELDSAQVRALDWRAHGFDPASGGERAERRSAPPLSVSGPLARAPCRW